MALLVFSRGSYAMAIWFQGEDGDRERMASVQNGSFVFATKNNATGTILLSGIVVSLLFGGNYAVTCRRGTR